MLFDIYGIMLLPVFVCELWSETTRHFLLKLSERIYRMYRISATDLFLTSSQFKIATTANLHELTLKWLNY